MTKLPDVSPVDQRTLAFYNTAAPVYEGSGAGGVSRHLSAFLARLPHAAHVLDLGCGGGRDAEAMMQAGHRVDPTDGSVAVARRAEERLGRPVRVMRFDELDADAIYDAVWANASLLHVPRAALPAILARVHTSLKPGGLHLASYKSAGAEGRDRAGRYFSHLTEAEIHAAYTASGRWHLVDSWSYVGGGYDGQTQGPWVVVTLKATKD